MSEQKNPERRAAESPDGEACRLNATSPPGRGLVEMERKRILIVDDSKTVQMMTAMLLAREPYAVTTAFDGEEGVRKALADPPDLILLDVVMPKMDGFEACRRLRCDPATQTVPIIMMTTRGEPVNVEQGYAAGCTDYITKPVSNTELLAKVRDCIQG